MNRQNVLIYLNSTGNEALDCKALAIMEEYCNRKGYKIVNSLGEFTDLRNESMYPLYDCGNGCEKGN